MREWPGKELSKTETYDGTSTRYVTICQIKFRTSHSGYMYLAVHKDDDSTRCRVETRDDDGRESRERATGALMLGGVA